MVIGPVLVPQLMRLNPNVSPELAGLTAREWTIDGGANFTISPGVGVTWESAEEAHYYFGR